MSADTGHGAYGLQDRPRQSGAVRLLLLLGVALVVAGQVATQVAAADFEHQAALGPRLGKLYAPWAVLDWHARWSSFYAEALSRALRLGGAAGLLCMVVGYRLMGAGAGRQRHLHGSARWAVEADLREAGLLAGKRDDAGRRADGVYVGAWIDRRGRKHYLRHSGPEHVLAYAPTRSGKGVGLVIPTLLSWPHSTLVTDLKGELWALTAGWRSRHGENDVLRFEPAASGSVRWNPLLEVRVGTDHEVGDAQNLAGLIVDPDGKGVDKDHWLATAQALIVGMIVHVLCRAEREGTPATISEIDRLLSEADVAAEDAEDAMRQLWQQMASYPHRDGAPHPVVVRAAGDMLKRPDREAASVLSTALRMLVLYRDPIVAENTSASDFCVKDLMRGDRALSVYLVTQPTDKDRLRPLVRIFVSMVIRKNAAELGFEGGRPKALYKHRLLLMLDEFTSMKKLSILQESLAFVAGYGIKAYLICQDIEQIRNPDAGYGPKETITSNCHIQVAFPPNKVETAEHLSKTLGQTTVEHEQVTVSGAAGGSRSRSKQWTGRPLLTPDECRRLPGPVKRGDEIVTPGEMIVIAAGYPAARGVQPLYFQDAVFSARAAVPAPNGCDGRRG